MLAREVEIRNAEGSDISMCTFVNPHLRRFIMSKSSFSLCRRKLSMAVVNEGLCFRILR